jgi:hypothetical protein
VICLAVVTDGREDYLTAAIESAETHLIGPISERVMYDDTGDDDYRRDLASRFPGWRHINAGPRQGFGGAIQALWRHLRDFSTSRWVFHLEQDFTFNRDVNLLDMVLVLEKHQHLVQLALRRQPWNEHERLAGGIVEQHPESYEERTWRGLSWLEHRLFFTTNPSLYRRALCWLDWPEGGESEGHFSHQIIQSAPDARFGFWGPRDSGEWVTHIGHERVGTGY